MASAITQQRPWLDVRYGRTQIVVTLTVPLGSGQRKQFTARVKVDDILEALRRRGIAVRFDPTVGGFFGKIWKGVKHIGKKIGVDKLVKVASKALPFAAKVLPPPLNLPAAGASVAIGVAKGLVKASKQRKRGDKRGAAQTLLALKKSSAKAKRALGRKRATASIKSGERLYRILVTPL